MTKAIFLLLVCLLCQPLTATHPEGQPSNIPTSKQPDSVLAFYPLQVGNLWQYHNHYCYCDCQAPTESYHLEEVVGDTVLENGLKYQTVVSENGLYPQYLRVDSLTANIYRYESGVERLVDSLLATEGSWFTAEWGFDVECTEVTIDTVLGQPALVKKFRMYYIHGGDYTLGHGFGRTRYAEYYEDCYPGLYTVAHDLVYARIDGQEFGTLVNIDEDQSIIPTQFTLHQNYPNPFNPSTTIRFELPRSGEVSLKVFNLLGEQVATLVSGRQDAGTHTMRWDATGQPSGVYFYRLRAGEFVETKKLVLVR